jgi:hypothetical protein
MNFRFEIGDKVVSIADRFNGKSGKIVKRAENASINGYAVRFEEGTFVFLEDELVLHDA